MAKSLKELREEARSCQDCPLWVNATQTGSAKRLPFVGPAGRLLDRALEAAGVDLEREIESVKPHVVVALGPRRRAP